MANPKCYESCPIPRSPNTGELLSKCGKGPSVDIGSGKPVLDENDNFTGEEARIVCGSKSSENPDANTPKVSMGFWANTLDTAQELKAKLDLGKIPEDT